jgi:anti-sigma regulatory factor (Ser/Thr protein kinase)
MMHAISVADPSEIAAARRAAADAASTAGFGEADAGRAALVATELATNLVRHGGGGTLLVDAAPGALTLVAIDRGRGMADVEACLRDGYSTAGTPGTGLGAIRRQSEAFDIFSAPGLGTAVLARLGAGRLAAAASRFAVGAVNLPKPGETVSGDAWDAVFEATVATVIVADGLGHGPVAAEAAQAAVRLFRKSPGRSPQAILGAVHAGLRPTRGGAVAVTSIDLAARTVLFSGLGNIAGTLLAGGEIKRMVSHNGTAGHIAPRLQEFKYAFAAPPLVILCSDGLATSWSLDRYPGLTARDPALIAAVLYRDHARGRDDVTVVAVQGQPS